MSYDLISYIRYEEKPNLEEKIIAFFKRYGFNIALHPEFDLLKCDGFNPFMIKKNSGFWEEVEKAPKYDVLTGQELYVNKAIEEEYLKKFDLIPITSTKNSENYVIMSVNHNDITEHCTNFIFSAAIVDIFHGILEDPQIGRDITGPQIDGFLQQVLDQDKNEDFSTAMPFDEWY